MWKSQQACKRQSRYKQFSYTSYKMKAKLSLAEICELRKNLLKQRMFEIWGFSFVSVSIFQIILSAKNFWYVTRNNIFTGNVNKFLIHQYVKSLWGGKLLIMFRKNFRVYLKFSYSYKTVCIFTVIKGRKRASNISFREKTNHRMT